MRAEQESRVAALIGKGDLLQAYDQACKALVDDPTAGRLLYLRLLALARMGQTAEARADYERFGLEARGDVDSVALGARLLKDEAVAEPSANRSRAFLAAAQAYRAAHQRTQDPFPAINAASLFLLGGRVEEAQALAETVLAEPRVSALSDYYSAVTAAEALLLLGRADDAVQAARTALALPGADAGARSTTCRQLDLLADVLGADASALSAVLRPPPCLTYSGHMFRADPNQEAALRFRIEEALDKHRCEVAFGALACGADILIAEAVLERGGELHVVLPYIERDFVKQSVLPGGGEWEPRFRRCLSEATAVTVASASSSVNDDNQYAYASLLMQGLARLRAAHLRTSAIQLAIWDGKVPSGVAGTGADIVRWRDIGGTTTVIAPGPVDRTRLVQGEDSPAKRSADRAVRAMIFTDFAGFSKLEEQFLPDFWREIMGRVGEIVRRYGKRVCSSNTWGDALFAVTEDAETAAELALELQAELARTRMDAFSEGAGMRISAHLGPVYEALDPVTGRLTFYGNEVNRTARIEPVTPVNQVYVSQAFAAILLMQRGGRYDLSYVGRLPLAKSYGDLQMYRLSSVHP